MAYREPSVILNDRQVRHGLYPRMTDVINLQDASFLLFYTRTEGFFLRSPKFSEYTHIVIF